MNSATLPSVWNLHEKFERDLKARAKEAYRLWSEDPFHPSLRFKCTNREENIWSVRIMLGYRALGVLDNETITWFWIGGHDDYERFFG